VPNINKFNMSIISPAKKRGFLSYVGPSDGALRAAKKRGFLSYVGPSDGALRAAWSGAFCLMSVLRTAPSVPPGEGLNF